MRLVSAEEAQLAQEAEGLVGGRGAGRLSTRIFPAVNLPIMGQTEPFNDFVAYSHIIEVELGQGWGLP